MLKSFFRTLEAGEPSEHLRTFLLIEISRDETPRDDAGWGSSRHRLAIRTKASWIFNRRIHTAVTLGGFTR